MLPDEIGETVNTPLNDLILTDIEHFNILIFDKLFFKK